MCGSEVHGGLTALRNACHSQSIGGGGVSGRVTSARKKRAKEMQAEGSQKKGGEGRRRLHKDEVRREEGGGGRCWPYAVTAQRPVQTASTVSCGENGCGASGAVRDPEAGQQGSG